MDEMERIIKGSISEAGMQYGVPFELINESKSIEKALGNIVGTLNYLRKTLEAQGTNTSVLSSPRTEKIYFNPIKKDEQLEKRIEEIKKLQELVEKDDRKND